MVRDRCVRLTKLPPEFEFCEVGKKDCRSRRSWERPLQEVNFSALALARDWKDELRVTTSCFCYAAICMVGDHCAKRLGVGCVTKTPYIFNLLGRKFKGLGNVDV